MLQLGLPASVTNLSMLKKLIPVSLAASLSLGVEVVSIRRSAILRLWTQGQCDGHLDFFETVDSNIFKPLQAFH